MCILLFLPTQQCCIPRRTGNDVIDSNASTKSTRVNQSLFEEDPSGNPVIDVKHLRKVFRSIAGKNTPQSKQRTDIILLKYVGELFYYVPMLILRCPSVQHQARIWQLQMMCHFEHLVVKLWPCQVTMAQGKQLHLTFSQVQGLFSYKFEGCKQAQRQNVVKVQNALIT